MKQLNIFNIPIPKDWKEIELDSNIMPELSKGRFAYFIRNEKKIFYFKRWYYLFFWNIIKIFAQAHERGHAWGIPSSGCLSNSRDCIMAEEKGTENFINKIKLWPNQAKKLGTFCLECQQFIQEQINFKE